MCSKNRIELMKTLNPKSWSCSKVAVQTRNRRTSEGIGKGVKEDANGWLISCDGECGRAVAADMAVHQALEFVRTPVQERNICSISEKGGTEDCLPAGEQPEHHSPAVTVTGKCITGMPLHTCYSPIENGCTTSERRNYCHTPPSMPIHSTHVHTGAPSFAGKY
ncbi:hypothetical protein LXL04_008915 [Taraxacum kok-saghyz]